MPQMLFLLLLVKLRIDGATTSSHHRLQHSCATFADFFLFRMVECSEARNGHGCDFTAQDVFEANYLLAVIHFFRSITKMFYGQDENPKNGTPPPLCYLTGLGAFQFDNHPLAVTNFTYSLPTDVDYIRAGEISSPKNPPATYSIGQTSKTRLQNLQPGAVAAPPQFSGAYKVLEPTYVPTKIQLSITAVPIMTRNMVSNDFSLKQYATGQLIKGAHTGSGGGFW